MSVAAGQPRCTKNAMQVKATVPTRNETALAANELPRTRASWELIPN
jgi:hypothetical protein